MAGMRPPLEIGFGTELGHAAIDLPPVGIALDSDVDQPHSLAPGVRDLAGEGRFGDREPVDVARLQQMKTGALLRYGCIAGAILGQSTPKEYQALDDYGRALGEAILRDLIRPGESKLALNLLPAVIRYVECKCLFGGVTTSQGIELFSNHGGRRYYRGVVRNVEQTHDPALPEAGTRIADVKSKTAEAFLGEQITADLTPYPDLPPMPSTRHMRKASFTATSNLPTSSSPSADTPRFSTSGWPSWLPHTPRVVLWVMRRR